MIVVALAYMVIAPILWLSSGLMQFLRNKTVDGSINAT